MLTYLLNFTNDIELFKTKFEFNDGFDFPPLNHISMTTLII